VSIQKIAIIKLGAIGDCVHALPFCFSLKSNLKDSHITWFISPKAYPILRCQKFIDRVVVVDLKRALKNPVLFIKKFVREFNEKFDIVFDIQGLFKSGFLMSLLTAKVKAGFSFKESRELNFLFVNKRIKTLGKAHVIEKYCQFLDLVNIRIKEVPRVNIDVPEHKKEKAYFLKKKYGDYILINPGAGFKSKVMPSYMVKAIAESFQKECDFPVLISYSNLEKKLALEIKFLCKTNNLYLLPDTDLYELIEIIKKAKCFIGPDCGPMHIANMLSVPVIAVFCPTSPQRNGPYFEPSCIVRDTCEYFPCQKRECEKRYSKTSVEEIVQAVKKFL